MQNFLFALVVSVEDAAGLARVVATNAMNYSLAFLINRVCDIADFFDPPKIGATNRNV